MPNLKEKKFRISSYKSKRYFWVYIHDTLEEFKMEAKAYHQEAGEKYVWRSEYGLFHPYEKWQVYKKKTKKLNNIGIIRLRRDKLYPRSVYHEVLHAALWQYRLKHRKKADFGTHITQKEEELCHIYNQLLSKTIFQIYKLGFWKSYDQPTEKE